MEMKTKAKGAIDELQIDMNTGVWGNLDGDNNAKTNKNKNPKALIP